MNKSQPPYDAVLFDLDGTLSDSYPGIAGSLRYVEKTLGLDPQSDDVLRRCMGPSLHESFTKHFGLDEDMIDNAIAAYREDFAVNGMYNNAIYKGIPNLIRSLKSLGVTVVLATSKPTVFARRILERFALLDLFDSVIGTSLDDRAHDKADVIRQAIPRNARRCVMVGDRLYDINGARANNIESIGVLYGYGSEAELVGAGADAVARDVDELTKILTGGEPAPQGFFITLEGVDGSGKSTVSLYLKEYLEQAGWDVLMTREPGGSPLGEKIRAILLDGDEMSAETEAYLFAASRAQHVKNVIAPALAQGRVVLCDRFVDSSVAYQGAGRLLGMDKVRKINEMAVAACLPDLVILLMVDLNTALLRRGSSTRLDRIESAGEAFFSRVYDGFMTIAQEEPDRIHIVDASRSIEDVSRSVQELAGRLIKERIRS